MNDTILDVSLIFSVDLTLLLQDLLQAKVLRGEQHGSRLGHLLIDQLLFCIFLSVKRGSHIEQFVSGFLVLNHALLVIIHQEAGLMVLIINLLKIAILATALFLVLFV